MVRGEAALATVGGLLLIRHRREGSPGMSQPDRGAIRNPAMVQKGRWMWSVMSVIPSTLLRETL